MADKSIAIMLLALLFLSRVSSSFIFILQQLLRDLSLSLCIISVWSFYFPFLFSSCSRTNIVINKSNSGTDNNLSLIKEWWSPERKAAAALNYTASKWVQVIFITPDKRFGLHLVFSALDIGNWKWIPADRKCLQRKKRFKGQTKKQSLIQETCCVFCQN